MIPQDILNWVETTSSTNKDKVVQLIEEFNGLVHPDPYFRMSDDPEVYRRGQAKWDDLVCKKQQLVAQMRDLING